MHLHIIGICGTFMGGLALLARARGHQVTGCDANVYPPMSTQLEAAGIRLIEGFSEDQLSLKPDLWVVGNVASRRMPLIEALLNARAPLVSGPQWLAEHLLGQHRVLAVSGTHGKTTTSSILAWLLEDAGLAPSFLIGGVPENFGVSARLSPNLGHDDAQTLPPFVIEADEYDTAFFDKRSKFLHYRAEIAILNNLEFDHADIFADLAAIETQFHHWVRTLPSKGRLVVNGQEPALARVLARGSWTPIDIFHDAAGWSIADAPNGSDQGSVASMDRFSVHRVGAPVGLVQSPLTGAHNRSNVLAAIAAATAFGVAPEQACESVSRFLGVKRRMQVRGEANGIRVLDDFAHHPTAIETTVAGLRHQMTRAAMTGRILAVIEPRSNTMKLGVMAAKLAGSLMGADRVFAFAGGIDWDLEQALSPIQERTVVAREIDDLVSAICQEARPGDQILVMSNGGFSGIHDRLLRRLDRSQ